MFENLYSFLLPTDTMERISKDEFLERFDELIGAMRKEEKGLIIKNNNRVDDIVVCPLSWFNYCFDDDFGCVITSAIRYAINRQSYMPEVVIRFAEKYKNVLDGKTLLVAVRDITTALENFELKERAAWDELKKSLTARLEEIEREGAENTYG